MIIQIALGIVLAVLILNFLPELIGLGAILIVIVIALVVGGLLLYWVGSNPAVLGFLVMVAVGVAIYLFWKKRSAIDAPARDLKERIRRRQLLGYDTVDLEKELSEAVAEAERAKKARTEKKSKPKSRRELGYTDDNDNA